MFKLSQRRTGRCLKTWQNRVPHSLGGRRVRIKTKMPQINNKMLPNLKTTDIKIWTLLKKMSYALFTLMG